MTKDYKLHINRNCEEALYIQLYKSLKDMIEKGNFSPNEKLPPIRKIATELCVNNSTVINAYKLLEMYGFVYTRGGSGTFVLDKKIKTSNSRNHKSEYSLSEKMSSQTNKASINFSSSTPGIELFPVDDFKNIINEVLDRDGGNAFSYTEVVGYELLRESIASHIKEDGIECSSDSIQIISGAQQGIDIIAKALIDYEDVIFTESPTYTGALAVFKSRGAKITGIPIERDGLKLDQLENSLRYVVPKFIYIMPNFQNPTGFSYSDKNKERLLFLADKYDFYIIEDDYLSELYYSLNKPRTLKSMDYCNRVIFIKSFSKIFMPGVRLGFLIVPDKVQNRVLAAKQLSDISTSGLMQRVFDLYIRKNLLSSYINYIKSEYLKRYEHLTSLLDNNCMYSYLKPFGGIHFWVKLNNDLSSNLLYSQCIRNGLIISPGSIFYLEDIDSPYFRLSIASTNNNDIAAGMNILNEVIEQLI